MKESSTNGSQVSNGTNNNINAAGILPGSGFQPFFMWPIIKIENNIEIASHHTYENMDNQFEKSVLLRDANSFSLKGSHSSMLLQGLEVKYRVINTTTSNEDSRKSIEYLGIDPVFGRKFGKMSLKSSENC